MAFMKVFTTNENMGVVVDDYDERLVPVSCMSREDMQNCGETKIGWFARLSAPGYMDCTEYSGPFATEQEAKDYVCNLYDCDEDGEDA